MSNDPLLTIDELATVLRVSVEMVRNWEEQAILPIEDDAEEGTEASGKRYRQRNVVLAIREYPEVMNAVKQAMMAKRGIVNEPAEETGK